MGLRQKVSKTITDQQRIEFARQVEHFYEAGYTRRPRILFFAFLKGIATGFGVFLGGTIIVALLAWTLSRLDKLPLVGDLSDATKQSIDSRN